MAYERKTRDSFEVRGNYGHGHGFEMVTAEETHKEARQRLREYRENEPGVPFKIVRVREPIAPEPAPPTYLPVTTEALLNHARGLRSEPVGANPEYDRALVELVRDCLGVTRDEATQLVLGS